jgi:diguanylate cyclase (GGDEF)-like protein
MHGHLVGDEVLRALAGDLTRLVRGSDLVGRFGGEEFVVLLPNATAQEACSIAERLRRGAHGIRVLDADALVGVTISIGVAALERDGHLGRDLFELLAAADLALYRAKNTGRDRVCLYDPPGAEASASQGPPGASH